MIYSEHDLQRMRRNARIEAVAIDVLAGVVFGCILAIVLAGSI